MKIVNEGNGLWGIDRHGERVVTQESYQVVSNICEMSVDGFPDECDEVRENLAKPARGKAPTCWNCSSHRIRNRAEVEGYPKAGRGEYLCLDCGAAGDAGDFGISERSAFQLTVARLLGRREP